MGSIYQFLFIFIGGAGGVVFFGLFVLWRRGCLENVCLEKWGAEWLGRNRDGDMVIHESAIFDDDDGFASRSCGLFFFFGVCIHYLF